MTQDEFIIEYVLRLAQNKRRDDIIGADMVEEDIEYAIDMCEELKSKGVEFEKTSHDNLCAALSTAFDYAQRLGGFCIQFNQEHPLKIDAPDTILCDSDLTDAINNVSYSLDAIGEAIDKNK